MRLTVLSVLALIAAQGVAMAQPPSGPAMPEPLLEDWQKGVWERNKEAIVRLNVSGRKNAQESEERQGTGFFFHRDGFIITAAHVIGKPSEWYTDVNGKLDRKIQVSTEAIDNTRKLQLDHEQVVVLYPDYQLDLALLRVKGMYPDGGYPFVKLGNSALVNPPDPVIAGVWHDRPSPVPKAGNVEIAFDPRASGLFRLKIEGVDHGDSGSPVFNRAGEVVGIVTKGDKLATDRPVFARPINFAGNLVNLTLRAAALDEALTILTKMQEDPIKHFKPVQTEFERIAKSIAALEKLAKNNIRIQPDLPFQNQPFGTSENLWMTIQLQDFPPQYLPERVRVTSIPAWGMTLKDEEKRPNVPGAMKTVDSKGAGVVFTKTVDISPSTQKTIGWNLEEWLRTVIEQRYGKDTEGKEILSPAALESVRITSADVLIEWWFKDDRTTYSTFYEQLTPRRR